MSASRTRFAHRPGTVLRWSALTCAVVVVALAGLDSMPAFAVIAIGLVAFVGGFVRSDRRWTAVGALALLSGVAVAGAVGTPPGRLLASTVAALLAWDFGLAAFDTSDELSGGTVERIEVRYVAIATCVGALAAGVAFVTYRSFAVGVSLSSVFFLLVAVVALGLAMRE